MSSLHHDHLLVEGSEPVAETANALPTVRGTSRRAVGPPGDEDTSKAPTQRQGTAQHGGATPSIQASPAAPRAERAAGADAAGTGSLASRGKAATSKAAVARAAVARAAVARAAVARAATARAATARAATANAAVARAATAQAVEPAASTPARTELTSAPAPEAAAETPAAESVAPEFVAPEAAGETLAAESVAPEAVAPEAVAPEAVAPGSAAAPRVRPTPYERAAAVAEAPTTLVRLPAAADLDIAAPADTDAADAVVVRADLPADPAPAAPRAGRLQRLLRPRSPEVRRRPALYVAAATAAALSVSAFSADEPTPQATATMSQSVSVAEQLGIEANPAEAIVHADATQQLGELAASRNVRDAEQAAAAQAQAEADRIAAAAAAEAARPKAVLPVQGARLTSGFGARWGSLHAGIDLAAPMHTPEFAVMDGVVLEAGPASGYGLVVYIQHPNGDVTAYGHMDQILVQAGQVVRAGDTIALLGNRGQSTGPHLHFEVHVGGLDGQKIDPLPWLRDKGVAI